MLELKRKKAAVVTDIVMEYGGAEKVLEVFLEMFPEADLYSLFVIPNARKKIEQKFPRVKIKTSIFQGLIRGNKVSKYISMIKFFSWIWWEILDLKKYDLIISSSHSFMSKNVKKGKGAIHLSYVHTPPRFLYDEYCEINLAKKLPLGWLRQIDKNGSSRPDIMVVNSENVKARVKKYYDREVEVVYPPVSVKYKKTKKKDYFICMSRLVKQKGIELAVETCTKYKLPLVVVGNGDEYENLKKKAGKTIKFIRNCNEAKKIKLLAEARALIYPSIEEDFGIVPVEAIVLGTPVAAFDSGGVRESVNENKTGVFFKKFDVDSLKQAIERLEKLEFRLSKEELKQYNTNTFKQRINKLICDYEQKNC